MPRRPRRGCAWQGCPRLAAEGGQYCEEHKALADKQYNQYERSTNVNKKYGRAWKRILTDTFVSIHIVSGALQKEE